MGKVGRYVVHLNIVSSWSLDRIVSLVTLNTLREKLTTHLPTYVGVYQGRMLGF